MPIMENKNKKNVGVIKRDHHCFDPKPIPPSECKEPRLGFVCFERNHEIDLEIGAKAKDEIQKTINENTLNFENIVKRYFRISESDNFWNDYKLNNRYRSWYFCRNKFYLVHKDLMKPSCADQMMFVGDIKDYLALHLGFYLASHGMYRGSSFLLFNDCKVHIPAVEEILKEEYSDLRDYDPFSDLDLEKLPDWLFENDGGLRAIYNEVKKNTNYPRKTKNTNYVSDIFITKVMLGTFGCIPAYDGFFIEGLKSVNFKHDFSKQSIQEMIQKLNEFYEVHDAISKYKDK